MFCFSCFQEVLASCRKTVQALVLLCSCGIEWDAGETFSGSTCMTHTVHAFCTSVQTVYRLQCEMEVNANWADRFHWTRFASVFYVYFCTLPNH